MATKFSAFDAAEYLDSEEAIASYLSEVAKLGDPVLTIKALEDVARARSLIQGSSDSTQRSPRSD
jgi:probable addiction module antidote protein